MSRCPDPFYAAVLAVLAVLCLAGCRPKAPACDEEAVLAQVRSTLFEHVKAATAQLPFGAEALSKPGFPHVLADLSVTLSDVTTERYRADAQHARCHVRVTVSASNRQGRLSRAIDYSVQAADGATSSPWTLQLSGDTELVTRMAQAVVSAVHQSASVPPNEAADQSAMEQAYLTQQAAARHDDANGMNTRFGTLSVSSDNRLLFNGKPTVPAVEGNSGLTLLDKKTVGDQDVVLVQDNGGTACPASYYFVQISQSGAVPTKAFGTCSDLFQLQQSDQRLTVTLPGFAGPFESEQERVKATRKKSVFVLENGVLSENGKPM